MRYFSAPACALLLLLVGCARYEYDVVRPESFAGHAGSKADYTFQRDPLEYRLRSISNRLVIRIYNHTDDSIVLLGRQSSVVDPDGQSHPLMTQTIAPNSFIKLILPPPRPRIYRSGPTFGVGVGTRIGRAGRGYHSAFDGDEWDEPRYFTVYDDADTVYWDWDDEGSVRIMLVYERGNESFSHEFVIRRVKM